MPGSLDLASADINLADWPNRESLLGNSLEKVRNLYDYVVLDCPPSLGLLTVNAITSTDYYIVTVTPDFLSFEGLVNFLESVDLISQGIGKCGVFLGIILTIADHRQKITGDITRMIRGRFGDLVFDNDVRVNVRLKEAPRFGKAIGDYAPKSQGAKAYSALTKEILGRIAGKENQAQTCPK